jgi:uncharacterized lipoprotein YddW (UPF0748 family)
VRSPAPKNLAGLLAPLLLLGGVPADAGPKPEMRGLWVVRTALVSPAAVDSVVDQAREAGFNALLVQVRGRGDAFYDSRLVPRSIIIREHDRGFDPLGRLLERARRSGLEVHAWINVLLSAHFSQPLSDDHIVAQHPEWLMVPRDASRYAIAAHPDSLRAIVRQASRSDPDVEGYYLSPSAPGVGERLESIVRELLRGYPVQGLHLDFIRYPGRDYDWSRAALADFARRRGTSSLLQAPLADPQAFDEYRRDVLTHLAERLAGAARAERPGIVVSAAVVPDDATALSQKFQNWPAWLSHGLLDAVCPMTYTPDARLFRRQVEIARTYVGKGQSLWAGVGAYRLDIRSTVERVRMARLLGASGVVLFSHESLAPGDLRRLRDEAFPARFASGAAAAAPATSQASAR